MSTETRSQLKNSIDTQLPDGSAVKIAKVRQELKDVIDTAAPVQNLTDLRNYGGSAGHVVAVGGDRGGLFVARDSDPLGNGDDGAVAVQATDGTWWARRSVLRGEPLDVSVFGTDQSAVRSALDVSKEIRLTPGTYTGQININEPGSVVHVAEGVTVQLPDSTVGNNDTSGPAALLISADGVDVRGRVTVDGNKATQATSSLTNGSRAPSARIAANDVSMDVVIVRNAYWNGFTIDAGDGTPAKNVSVEKVVIDAPENWAAKIWTADGYDIEEIVVKNGGPPSDDHRVRFGNDGGTGGGCRDGHVGAVCTPKNAVVVEQDTEDLKIGKVRCSLGKIEACTGIEIGSWIAKDNTGGSWSFAVNGAQNVHVGTVRVRNDQNTLDEAIRFRSSDENALDCTVGTIDVQGTQGDRHGVRISDINGLIISTAIARLNGGRGIWLENLSSADQGSIVVESAVADQNDQSNSGRVNIRWEPFDGAILGSNPNSTSNTASLGFPNQVGCAANFDVDGGNGSITVNSSFNVSSISESATGEYQIDFGDGFFSGKIIVALANDATARLLSQSTTGATIETVDAGGNKVRPSNVQLVAFETNG